MKLTHYIYHLDDGTRKIRFDLRRLLKAFTGIKDIAFKNSFMHLDDHLYLIQLANNFYIFIMTKDNEIIKTINSTNLDLKSIYERLARGEMVGFASYIYFGDRHYSIASTVYGPRNGVFINLVNSIIGLLCPDKYSFMANPLSTSISRSEALSLPYVGCTTLEVANGSSLFTSISEFYGFKANDKIDAFEIKLKPQRKHDITKAFRKVLKNTNDEGLRKFTIKAKADLEAALSDYYIIGNGFLADSVSKGSDIDIYNDVVNKLRVNTELSDAIEEYNGNSEFITMEVKDLQHYFDSSSWASIVDSVVQDVLSD